MSSKTSSSEQHRCEHPQCGRVATHMVSGEGRGRLLCSRHVESYKTARAFVLPLKPADHADRQTVRS
jgi:hypothetical protein